MYFYPKRREDLVFAFVKFDKFLLANCRRLSTVNNYNYFPVTFTGFIKSKEVIRVARTKVDFDKLLKQPFPTPASTTDPSQQRVQARSTLGKYVDKLNC